MNQPTGTIPLINRAKAVERLPEIKRDTVRDAQAALDELARAKAEYDAKVAAIQESFDLTVWRVVTKHWTPVEIAAAVAATQEPEVADKPQKV